MPEDGDAGVLLYLVEYGMHHPVVRDRLARLARQSDLFVAVDSLRWNNLMQRHGRIPVTGIPARLVLREETTVTTLESATYTQEGNTGTDTLSHNRVQTTLTLADQGKVVWTHSAERIDDPLPGKLVVCPLGQGAPKSQHVAPAAQQLLDHLLAERFSGMELDSAIRPPPFPTDLEDMAHAAYLDVLTSEAREEMENLGTLIEQHPHSKAAAAIIRGQPLTREALGETPAPATSLDEISGHVRTRVEHATAGVGGAQDTATLEKEVSEIREIGTPAIEIAAADYIRSVTSRFSLGSENRHAQAMRLIGPDALSPLAFGASNLPFTRKGREDFDLIIQTIREVASGHPRVHRILQSGLADPQHAGFETCLSGLGGLRDRASLPRLRKIIDSARPDDGYPSRSKAVRVLGLVGGEEVVDELIGFLLADAATLPADQPSHIDNSVTGAAALALRDAGACAVDSFAKRLGVIEGPKRRRLAQCLGIMGKMAAGEISRLGSRRGLMIDCWRFAP